MPLALAIARKLTKRLGEIDPRVVEANLRDAVRLVSGPHDVRIVVNTQQHAIVNELLPRLKQQWPKLQHVTVVPDDAMAPGGCRVNTTGGEINADLDHQLNRLIDDLVGVAGA